MEKLWWVCPQSADFSYQSLNSSQKQISEKRPEKDGDRPELTVPFDEQEFLQGKIPVLGGEAKPREPVGGCTIYSLFPCTAKDQQNEWPLAPNSGPEQQMVEPPVRILS